MEDFLEEYLLDLLKGRRPSKNKGIGLRGGLLLAVLWAPICGVAGAVGWNIWGAVFSGVIGAVVGYRLERVSGAVAVAIFSVVFWTISATEGWGPFIGMAFGGLGGLGIGIKTREQSQKTDIPT
jgi:hypothetical protein